VPVTKPFRRTCRAFVDGKYSDSGQLGYVTHAKFADDPHHYVRAYEVIQKDLLELFDYVEPSHKNLKCYSYRIHELLMRTCMEVEANCKAILTENGYPKSSNWNMTDYNKLNQTHRLSSYQVKLPVWRGPDPIRRPYAAWATPGTGLSWYQAYNDTKHDRHQQFESANFENLLDAIAGLVVILAAQFHNHDFRR
jgi:hypothetical protein